ncbi:glycosyltransferase [Candidatus Saccharibacteria bacterium]|nr:glycosyltransferase [Candidatus Saccharibacteria bacterium]
MKRNTAKLAPYSVLMAAYKRERPGFLYESIDSMLKQTLPFDEFIIVKDGKLTEELDEIINTFVKKDKRFKVVALKNNCGLGIALAKGLNKCANDYVLRMDSDDISLPDRAETQMNFMKANPQIDVCGGDIYEFRATIDEPDIRLKKMASGQELEKYLRKRNPLNHMTVCLKKSAVERAGGYEDMPCMEDYWLWVRLYNTGGKLANIGKPLVYARIGNGFEKRRGNKAQLKSWKTIQQYMLRNKMITPGRKRLNSFNMWAMVRMPNFTRKLTYGLLRKK